MRLDVYDVFLYKYGQWSPCGWNITSRWFSNLWCQFQANSRWLFLRILLQFRTVSSPPEPKPKQQQPNVQDEAEGVSRSPVISNEDIEELKSVAVNKNTSSSTKQWVNVFNSWCSCRHLDINIETMAPEKLDKPQSKFYAEVGKRTETISSQIPWKLCRVPLRDI